MNLFKDAVVRLLHKITARYIERNSIKVIAVVGSVGKTSTANAIRTVLHESGVKVQISKTNYNTNKSIHLQIFNIPFATSFVGWSLSITRVLLRSLKRPPYTHIILELGTDAPGDLAHFKWLAIDTLVITAIKPEHMQNFKDLDHVADEELTLTPIAHNVFYNSGSIDKKYQEIIHRLNHSSSVYGAGDYGVVERLSSATIHGTSVKGLKVVGEHSLYALSASIRVALHYGCEKGSVFRALQKVEPVAGRMQKLHGIKNSIIIDDSYNASPDAVVAALTVLNKLHSKYKIALLGQMNELGDHSEKYHRYVGSKCYPKDIDLVVTLGPDSNLWLAQEAEKNGCATVRTTNPYEAGDIIRDHIQDGSVILVKGSQNRVFAEEAIKKFLADKNDANKLTRQSDYWLQKKKESF